jgi:endonuclease/exonuclease/phosphatase family metal-dependent hydrolase
MQLNIWAGRLIYPLLEQIREKIQPDIICMQEVIDLKGTSGNFFATLDDIQIASGLSYKYMSPNLDFRFMNRKAYYGNAILSRFELSYKNTFTTHGEYAADFDWGKHENDNIRSVQHIKLKNSNLNILNTHGFFVPSTKLGNEQTMQQNRAILDYAQSLNSPIIICGDFNLVPESESIQLLDRHFTNLVAKSGAMSTYSTINWNNKTHKWDELVCDYIFTSPDIKINKFEISEEIVSDHKALILDFDV